MKFKNMKRFGSIVMAGAMALSLVVPAFAEAAANPNQTVVDGGYVATPISVIVPATGSATINPYGLPVVVSAKADGTAISIADQQITNVPMYIGNYGTTPLDVNATLLVKPEGGVSIKGSAIAGTDKGKEMNVTLEIAGLNDDAYKQSMESEALVLALHEKFADDATWDGLVAANKLTAPAYAKGATTAPAAAKSSAKLATLGAATVAGEAITYGPKSIALFRLAGQMNAEPEKTEGGNQVEDPWVAEDGFEATIVFKFKPSAKYTVTIGTITGGSVTADVTKAYEGDTVTLTATPTTTGQTPTYTVKYNDGTSDQTVTVTNGKFVMPAYAVEVTAAFA